MRLITADAVKPTVSVLWHANDPGVEDRIRELAVDYHAEPVAGGRVVFGDDPTADELFEYETFEKAQEFEFALRREFEVEE